MSHIRIELNDPRASTEPMLVEGHVNEVPQRNETIEVEGVLYRVINVRHALVKLTPEGNVLGSHTIHVVARAWSGEDILR